jgi:hypothetical protein
MILGNPAHHLHQILTAFDNHASPHKSVRDTWEAALACDEQGLAACFQGAMSLVPQIRTRIENQGLAGQVAVVNRYESEWLAPFLPDRSWDSKSSGLVGQDSLLALSSLATIMGMLDQSRVVSAEQSESLLRLIDEARAAMRDDASLPLDLRTLILDRLHDVEWAVEHFMINGPEGLQAALDRLGAAMARTGNVRGEWRRKAAVRCSMAGSCSSTRTRSLRI